jgi:hypothetical protein
MLQDKYGVNFISLPPHIQEQVVYRAENSKCSALPECTVCGCAIPGLFYADKACQGGCYPKMMSEQEWNTFKETPEQYKELGNTVLFTESDLYFEGNQDEVVNGSFKIKNIGNEVFKLDRISASCGCTIPEYEKNVQIKQGEEMEFKFKMKLTSENNKFIYVHGNAPMIKIILHRKFKKNEN